MMKQKTLLVTLHAYAGSIDDMVVYSDTETLIVSGACGAWQRSRGRYIGS